MYCDVRNDVDLNGKYKYSIKTKQSNRICPQCDKPLDTIKLDLGEPFYIERCKSCFGLFFDPGEIDTLLESSVSNVFDINLKMIKNINKDRYQKHKKVKYVKCPICRILMNRVNYAHRSGVILDQCKKHGIWVDSGEITHLMEWKKAGGELLHQKNQSEQKTKKKTSHTNEPFNYELPSYRKHSKSLEDELLDTVSSVISRLFS